MQNGQGSRTSSSNESSIDTERLEKIESSSNSEEVKASGGDSISYEDSQVDERLTVCFADQQAFTTGRLRSSKERSAPSTERSHKLIKRSNSLTRRHNFYLMRQQAARRLSTLTNVFSKLRLRNSTANLDLSSTQLPAKYDEEEKSIKPSEGRDFRESNSTTEPSNEVASISKGSSITSLFPYYGQQRQDYLTWEEYFMAVAFLSAQRSKDPASQVSSLCLLSCISYIKLDVLLQSILFMLEAFFLSQSSKDPASQASSICLLPCVCYVWLSKGQFAKLSYVRYFIFCSPN